MKLLPSRSIFPLILALVLGGMPLGLSAFDQTRITEENLISLAWNNDQVWGITTGGGLVMSQDLGVSFTEIEPAIQNVFELRAIAATGDTLIAVGVDGLIYRSGDAGDNWSTIDAPAILGDLQTIAPGPMISGQQSWVTGGSDGFDAILGRSLDDGLTWTSVSPVNASGEITGLAYDPTAERWLAVGIDGFSAISFTSVDQGATWSPVTVPLDTPGLRAVASDGEGNFIAVGDEGTILNWVAGAWAQSFSPTVFETYFAVVSTGTNSWVAAGQDSVVATISGSSISQVAPEEGSGDIKALLYLPDPEDLLLLGGEDLVELDPVDPGPQPPDMTTAVLTIVRNGSGDLLLTLNIPNADAGNTFRLESSTTLSGWQAVPASDVVINAFPYTWSAISINSLEPRRFWRAVFVPSP